MIRPGPTSILVCALGLVPACGALFYPGLSWLVLLHLLAFLALSANRWARRPRPLHLELQPAPPPGLLFHTTSTLKMRLTNHHHAPMRICVMLHPPDGLGCTASPFAALLAPGETADIHFPVRPWRRGDLGPCRLGVLAGDGLAWVEHRFRLTPWENLSVAPAPVAPALTGWLTTSLLRRHAAPLPGEGRFAGLRPLLPGEDARQLCWSASARLGQPMTRLWDDPTPTPMVFILDAGAGMRVSVGPGEARMDRACSLLLALARALSRGGLPVGLLVWDQAARHWIPPGRGSIDRLAPLLAGLQCADQPWSPERLAGTPELWHHEPAHLVLITEPDGDAQRLAAAMHTLRRHHPLDVLLLGDPLLDDLLQRSIARPAADSRQVYTAAACALMDGERAAAVAQFAQAGASVLDLSRGRMPRQAVAK